MSDVLKALATEEQTAQVTVEGRSIRLTSLERVLWPRSRTTKRDLLRYLVQVAPRLLEWVADRPLTLFRCPEGVAANCWYQTTCPHRPTWLRTQRVPSAPTREYCVVDDLAGLLWAGNLSAVELHRLQSTCTSIDLPTDVVFDLDPGPDAGLAECAAVAQRLRRTIESEAEAIPVLSGGLGLHVYVPLAKPMGYEETRGTARRVAHDLMQAYPDLVTDAHRRDERGARVLIDWGQNHINRSLIAPFSPRATPLPSAASPITWDEVDALTTHIHGDR